jgi:hypothetical protein
MLRRNSHRSSEAMARGLLERLGEAARISTITIEAADLPEETLALLDLHHFR